MALITSGCDKMRSSSAKMALIASGFARPAPDLVRQRGRAVGEAPVGPALRRATRAAAGAWSETPIRDISRCYHPLTVVPCLRFGPRRTCWRRARPGPACFADHPDALPLGCALLSHVSQRTTCSMDISIGMETRRDTQSIHRIPAGVLLPSLPPAGVSTGMGRGCQQN